jgi:TonB-dependent starch-binding outer membrane protein SusC
MYGYKIDGFFNTQAEVDAYKAVYSGSWITPKVGGWRVKDLNDDKIIDANDKTNIGSSHPDFQLSFNLSLTYKNFDMSTFIFWNQGGKLYNQSRQFTDFNQFTFNRSTRMLNRSWTEGADNSKALLPMLDITDSQSCSNASDYFVEDATFVRMKNLQIGYTFPARLVNKLKLDRVRMYVQSQNIFTVRGGKKPFTGLDPDTALAGTDISMGVVESQNPTPRQIVFGINLGF